MEVVDPFTLLGSLGVVLILLGIWRTSRGKWRVNSFKYELAMVVGASLIIVYQLHKQVYVTLPINLLLVYVSLRGLSTYAERYAVRVKRKQARRLKASKRR